MRSLLLAGVLVAAPAFAQSVDCANIPETAEAEPLEYAHCTPPGVTMSGQSIGALPAFGLQLRSTSPLGAGFITFDYASPAAGTLVGPAAASYYGGDFAGDNFTEVYAANTEAGVVPSLVRINVATGVETTVGSTGLAAGANVSGMAWDYTTSTMYASTTGSPGNLYTVDMMTGAFTAVGPLAGDGLATAIDLMADPNTGDLFVLDIGNESLYSVDKASGNASLIGAIGILISFAQGADFDNASGVLYACTYTGGGVNSVRTINTTTGASTEVGQFNNSEVDICASMNARGGTSTDHSAADTGLSLWIQGANPVRGQASLMLQVTEPQPITVEAFDLMGRRVALLHSGDTAVGDLPLTLDVSSVPAGLYIVRATGASASATVRVTTVR